jgi:hypothetical protein
MCILGANFLAVHIKQGLGSILNNCRWAISDHFFNRSAGDFNS